MRKIEMIGRVFGKLTVIEKSLNKTSGSGGARWICKCECGGLKDADGSGLRSGNITSCGCNNGRFKTGVSRNKIHGFSKDELFKRWLAMLQRGGMDKLEVYKKHYWGKGIIVCDEWKNDYVLFRNWALKNGWQRGLSLERKDSNKNYEPLNCEWILKGNQWITKNNTVKVSIDGNDIPFRILYLKGQYPVSYKCAIQRVRRYGWSFEKALNTPPMNLGNRIGKNKNLP